MQIIVNMKENKIKENANIFSIENYKKAAQNGKHIFLTQDKHTRVQSLRTKTWLQPLLKYYLIHIVQSR